MALKARAKFIYGYTVSEFNNAIDFKASSSGPILLATLRNGYYSLSGLMQEIARAMKEVDQDNDYTVTADRTVSGGTEVRVKIQTSGTFLSILFGSGPRASNSIYYDIGFLPIDYIGNTLYQSSLNSGTHLVSEYPIYSYVSPDQESKVFGSVNVSASGVKESIVYNIQRFISATFKYEPRVKVENEWKPFFDWAIQQRPFEIVPEINKPNIFYDVTLEKTSADGKGLAYKMTEMLPDFPDFYTTGNLQFRVRNE
jgi:hypothetical protein